MKEDMKDVTFLVLVKIDTVNRLENVLAVTDYLGSHCLANIKVWECGSFNNHVLERLIADDVEYEFHIDYDPMFHRTKYLNEMTKTAQTPIVSIWDADVVIPCKQIIDSVKALRENADVVYPYDGTFYDTSDELRRLFIQTMDISVLERHTAFMRKLFGKSSVGGAFFAKKDKYEECGLENEDFYGWGLEDGERYHRFAKRASVQRINGALFHLSHPRGENSSITSSLEDLAKRRKYFMTNKEWV